MRDKFEALDKMIHLCKKLQIEKNAMIAHIRSDHGKEFENSRLASFCNDQGTRQEFSAPKTPQQNGVVERKNRVIQEMAGVMLNTKSMAKSFWGEAVNIVCHTLNMVYFRPDTKKTPYQLWRGKKPIEKYFRIFGSECYTTTKCIFSDETHFVTVAPSLKVLMTKNFITKSPIWFLKKKILAMKTFRH